MSKRKYQKILLVNPHHEHHKAFIIIPPLGLGSLAASLKESGYEVSIWDGMRDNSGYSELVDFMEKEGPFDVVGISIYSSYFNTAAKYIAAIRRQWPDTVTIAGGPHPTFEPSQTLRDIPDIDYVIRSEGEIAIVQLLDEINKESDRDLDSVDNLAWRNDGAIKLNDINYIQSLDDLKMTDWKLLKPEQYPLRPNGMVAKSKNIYALMVTRGCPFKCSFCGGPSMLGHKLRTRSVDNVIAEIEYLIDQYNMEEFHIYDDNFTFNQAYVKEFCQKLIEKKINVIWGCPNGVRLDCLSPETVSLMEKSGCYSFAVGIECGTQRILDLVHKKVTLETIRSQIAMIKKHGKTIRLTGLFLLGLPAESLGDIVRTVRFSLSLPLNRATFANYSPYPGSDLYHQLRSEGRLDGIDISQLFVHNYIYTPPKIKKWQLVFVMRVAYLAFYLRPRILFGVLREVNSLSQASVIAYRLLSIFRGKV